MEQYGVLIADDSAFMRRAISKILETDPQFFVVGIARNGSEAIEKAQRLKPDVITMDVEMPEMDGITALEEIMRIRSTPIVMLSSYTTTGAASTVEALERGAVDFFLKDEMIAEGSDGRLIEDFLHRMKNAARANLPTTRENTDLVQSAIPKAEQPPQLDLIVIGCSTGGPSALQSILPRIPSDFPVPVLVVQHMPPGFTRPLAERFDHICKLKVKEAENRDTIIPGTILIAPAGYQTEIVKQADGSLIINVHQHTTIDTLYKPSIDVTLSSAAPAYKERMLAVILTGMGSDGLEGCKRVKQFNGRVLSEAEESCIVYGMPKVIFEHGLSDRQCHLSNMYHQILSFV